MEITLSLSGTTPVFHLIGRLNVTTAPHLEDRLKPLLQVSNQQVIFDCAGLSYVSSAGLRVFLATFRHLSTHGGGVAFASLTQPVNELFRLAGLENLLTITNSVEEAVVQLMRPPR
jgi:anti-anti-sigma factor